MNPELLNRIKNGSFVKIVLREEVTLLGYAGADLESPALIRFDSMVLGDSGYLEKVSLQMAEEDIATVHFLPEAPVFVDHDGNEIRMEPGFFQDF
jgi:hypothetical protein